MGSTVGLAGAAILKRKKGKIIILKAELSQSEKREVRFLSAEKKRPKNSYKEFERLFLGFF